MQDDLIMRLKMVENHDWRVSFLAHTSDTARFAREELTRLRAAVERLTRERDKALGHIHLAREEMWVDYCLARNRTDLPSTEFNARPVVRSIDAAIRALENPNA